MKILMKTSKGSSALVSIATGAIRCLTLLFFLVFVSVIDTAIAADWAYTESEALQTTNSLSYVDAARFKFAADAGDYIVVAAFEFYGTSSSYQVNARLLIDGVPEGLNTQNANGTLRYSIGWIKKVTFTAGVKTISIQFNTADASGTAYIRNIHLFAWKAPTFQYNATEADTFLTTTEKTLATVTFTPPSTQDYLILASVEGKPGSTSYSVILRLKVDGVEKNLISSEAENANDYRAHGISLLQNLDTTSHTIVITGQEESGADSYANRIRLAAIPLSSLTHYSSADESETSSSSTSYVDKLSYSPTISSAGDHIIFASSEIQNDSGVYYYYNNLLIDSTQYHEAIGRDKDNTDYLPTFFLKKQNLSAASHTFNIQHKTSDAGIPVYTKNARIAVLQLPQQSTTDRGPVEDSTIFQVSPNSNYGSIGDLYIRSYSTSNNNRRSLLRFDLSSIPAGSTINSATLGLYYYSKSVSNPVGRTYRANRLTAGWIEGGWNSEPGVTWNTKDGATAWGTGGGDFTATDSATTTVPAAYGWMGWTVTNIAQGWVNGSYPNNGFLIKDDTEGSATDYYAQFYSQDATADRFLRPFIYIDYTPASEDLYWIQKSDDEESTTTSTTYQNKLTHTFTPNGVGHWLVISSFELVTPEPAEYQTAYQAKGRVQFDGSDIAEFLEEPHAGIADDKYLQRTYTTHKIYESLAASAHTITIDYASETSGRRVGIRKARIIATQLDAATGYQYAYNTAEAEVTNLSTTYTTIVTQNFTPSSSGKYLIVASAETGSDWASNNTYTRLNINGSYYGESIRPDSASSFTDSHSYFHFAVVNLTGSTTFSLEAKSSSGSNPYSDIRRSRITAIRLDGVYTYYDAESRAESSTASASYSDKATLQFTPSSGANYLVLAESLYHSDDATYAQRHRVWYDNLKEMYEYTTGGLNYFPTSMIKNQYLDNSQHTIKIQYAQGGTGTCYIKDAAILAIMKPAQATSVDLISFTAAGGGAAVRVGWTTAQEINTVGFHVYRSESVGGPYTRITDRLIPGLTFSVRGRDYSYVDRNVTRGRLYFYKLEETDTSGERTMHGPVCVDWDGDGIPDDWEIRYGLNPAVDDSGLDADGDGLTNIQEYHRGTDPFRVDTDGDGVSDSQESGGSVSPGLMRGVEVIASDAAGMTLELRTESFESVVLVGGGISYRRLRVPEYVHGYTEVVGKPELPVKGILIDLPAGKGGTLSIESVESKELSNYWIYPVPEKVMSGEGELATVSEVFTIDDASYRVNSFYPDVVAKAGETYDYRGQKKLQVFFNPFSFNPVSRELIQYTRIRVRVEYVALAEEVPVVRSGVSLPPAPASAYKLLVSEEGIYRLTSAWLTAQGVSVSDWSQVRVYYLGQEIPLYQGADYIEFYGTPPGEAYSKYAKSNVYWLTTSGGSGSPLRMSSIDGTPGTATIPGAHVFTAHTEQDKQYWGGTPGAESLDRWVSSALTLGPGSEGGGPVDYPVTLPGVGGSQLGQVTVLLFGLSTLGHDVQIAVNGVSLGTYQWSGVEFYEVTVSDVPLVEGINTLTFTCLSGADPENPDSVILDWVEVAYPRKYEANGNLLKLTHNAGYRYQVGNFTGSTIQAYDISTPTDVKRVANVQVTGSNPYTLTMEPRTGSGERTYIALSSAAVKTPASITRDTAGDLSGTGNGADYILITHRNLGWDGGGTAHPWLTNLKSHRETQGLRVKVVDVEDIYDEFSYGIVSPQGIKDFLSYTYQSWVSPAPQYVVLVGDSTYDPKDNLVLGSINYVPTYLAQTPFMGESLTDEWYVRISGNDAIADMDIGRLPASTTAQAETMVNKIISYENTPVLKTWERNTLLVADNQVEGYEVAFELMNEEVAGLLPTGMNSPFREYLNDYVNPADLTQSMINRLNADGALIWNYSGHGSVQVWARESIFSTGHVAGLNNSGKLPFMVAMTCLNGFFGYPEGWNYPSLAEVLLRNSNNGAVAAFMSTGMTEPDGQRVLDQALFEGIFKRDKRTLGSAISYAKQELVANSVALGETGKTFLLFGDPAMRLKVPLPTAPTAPTGQVSGNSVTLTWGASTDANGTPVAGYNVYRSTSPNGPYTKLNSSLVTGTSYTDSTGQSGTYYYVIKSVDNDGDESPGTLEMTVTIGAGGAGGTGGRSVGGTGGGTGGSGAGGGGGCFVSTIAN